MTSTRSGTTRKRAFSPRLSDAQIAARKRILWRLAYEGVPLGEVKDHAKDLRGYTAENLRIWLRLHDPALYQAFKTLGQKSKLPPGEFEQRITLALKHGQKRAAEMSGISPPAMNNLMKRYRRRLAALAELDKVGVAG